MLIEQIVEFELRGPGPHGRTCTPITGKLHDKTKISKENLLYMAEILLEAMCLTSPTWTKSLIIKILHHNARF